MYFLLLHGLTYHFHILFSTKLDRDSSIVQMLMAQAIYLVGLDIISGMLFNLDLIDLYVTVTQASLDVGWL